MTVRLLSPRLAAQGGQPQTTGTLVPDHPRRVRPFPARKPVAAAVVAALLLGATLPVAQHAGAQVEPAREGIAPAPGASFEYVDISGVARVPVFENATIVPAVPSASNDIQLAPGDVQPGR